MQKTLKKYLPIFVLPTGVAFAISFLIPFVMGLYLSFTKFTTVTNSKWVGFSNYIRAFTADDNFVNALKFTVKFTIVSIITINVFAFILALLLTKSMKGTNLFRTVFFMPNLIGGIVLGYIWNLLINGVLAYFSVDITYDAKYGFWGLVILMNWQLIGYMMVIYIAGLQNIPNDLKEAAAIDGDIASPCTTACVGISNPRVILPSIRARSGVIFNMEIALRIVCKVVSRILVSLISSTEPSAIA